MLEVKEKRENAKIILEQVRNRKVGKTEWAPSILEKEWEKTLAQTGIISTRTATVEQKRDMLKRD